MKTNNIIVGFKEHFGGKNITKSLSQSIYEIDPRFKRVIDISQEILWYKGMNVGKSSKVFYKNEDELFDREIYDNKSFLEQKLYRAFKLECNKDEAVKLMEQFKRDERIEYVEYDQLNEFDSMTDPYLDKLWAFEKIDNINLPITKGNEVIVAVIDTGVDYNHPDIKDRMWQDAAGNYGKDCTQNNNDPMDEDGHGTHIAGIIAASANNGIGILGVAPYAKIMAVKVAPEPKNSVCSAAIYYAVSNGANILNNCWGVEEGAEKSKLLNIAIDYAHSFGVSVICSAGNNAMDMANRSPANHPKVICVGATNKKDERWGGSNYGDLVAIAAPGELIYSLIPNNDYCYKKGTSMAVPYVSGLVALMLSVRSAMTPEEIKEHIQKYADDIITDKPIGNKRINIGRCMANLSIST